MIATGMIYQYDTAQGIGLIMLTDGETKQFSKHYWVDTDNEPAVGQKISYEDNYGHVQIKIASEELSAAESSTEDEKVAQEEDAAGQFSTVEDFITYYTDSGFKLVSDNEDGESRTITFRLYTPTDYGEATIKKIGSEITVMQVLNGKKETLSVK